MPAADTKKEASVATAGGPLSGLTVVAVEQYGAGPYGSMLLADLGARVIKVEPLGGEVGRQVGPEFASDGNSLFFHAFNRNKQSLELDLKSAEGQAALRKLVARADALLDNLRGDLPERLGLTYAALADVAPHLVCVHLSAYGRDGARRDWPGYDYLMQAEAGYLSLTGEPGTPPTRFGLSIVDMMTGMAAALALVAGLYGARAAGRGRDIDVSLYDVAVNNLNYLAAWYLNRGRQQGREARSAHPSLVPSQLCRTRDGWIFVMCNKERFWPLLACGLDHPEWAGDSRFATFADRLAHRALLSDLLDEAFSRKTTAEWIARLGGSVPLAPVYDIAQALDSDFLRMDRGAVLPHLAADGAELSLLGSPFRVAGFEPARQAGPALGAHDADVTAALAGTPAAASAEPPAWSAADLQRYLHHLLRASVDAENAARLARRMTEGAAVLERVTVAILAHETEESLFDVWPSHHDRAMAQAAARQGARA
jgi:succinate---hydroxymethylglutarate CoA-transferase